MNSKEPNLTEADIDRFRKYFTAIEQGVATMIVGQKDVVAQLSAGLMCGGHILLVGVPGLGKTLLAKTITKVLGWQYQRIQFTPDLMPADITGTQILQSEDTGQRRELVFHKGPIFTNLLLADEINRTPPKTQAALLEAMQELAVTIGGTTHQINPPFVVIATQNPIEQEGTYPLPEAQLDRFLLSIHIDYPSTEEEAVIAQRPANLNIPDIEPVSSPEEFASLVKIIDHIPISSHVVDYTVNLTKHTRPKSTEADDFIKKYVNWGVGPRATQHLITAAKTVALLDGRPSPEVKDIKKMAVPVLRHRIILNYKALGEGIESPMVIEHLLQTLKEKI